MSRTLLCVLLASSVATGAACKKTAAVSAPPADASKAAATPGAAPGTPVTPPWADPKKPVPAQLPDVLARVNGESVNKTDFDRLVKNIEASAGRPIPAEKRDEVLRGALDQLVTLTVLAQESKARSVVVTDAEIEGNMSQLRGSFQGTDEQFQAALTARGMTKEQMRTDAVTQLRINKMIQAEVATVAGPSDAEAHDYYDKNPDRFKPEEVRASHILIGVRQNSDEATVRKAQARAAEVLKQAESGVDFAGLARKFSDDESKKKGGDLDFFARGKLPREFEDVAFSLKPGQLSGIVTTQFGFHIIKTTDRRVLPMLPFEQVSSQIREMLFAQRKEERATSLVDSIKKKAKIEVLI